MNLGLAGKVALVTGAGRDIGREIALVLGREGAAVAVNYSTSSRAMADLRIDHADWLLTLTHDPNAASSAAARAMSVTLA